MKLCDQVSKAFGIWMKYIVIVIIVVIHINIIITTTKTCVNLCDEVGKALGCKQKDRLVDVSDP